MVKTENVNLFVTRGDHATKTFTVLDNGSNYDTSTSTLVLTIKSTATGAELHSITGTGGDGTMSFDFTPTETANVGTYVYDIQETTVGSDVRTLVIGNLYVRQDVNN